eukprot:Filipodium_phascolosomae@DN485_c0_g1_i1.p1
MSFVSLRMWYMVVVLAVAAGVLEGAEAVRHRRSALSGAGLSVEERVSHLLAADQSVEERVSQLLAVHAFRYTFKAFNASPNENARRNRYHELYKAYHLTDSDPLRPTEILAEYGKRHNGLLHCKRDRCIQFMPDLFTEFLEEANETDPEAEYLRHARWLVDYFKWIKAEVRAMKESAAGDIMRLIHLVILNRDISVDVRTLDRGDEQRLVETRLLNSGYATNERRRTYEALLKDALQGKTLDKLKLRVLGLLPQRTFNDMQSLIEAGKGTLATFLSILLALNSENEEICHFLDIDFL